MSTLNLPKDSEIGKPLSNHSVVDSPFSNTAPTKELSNKTSVLSVSDQGEQRDVTDLKSMQGTSEDHEQINELPIKPSKVETESSKCMWYEAKNNNGDIYYWNEKTMVVSERKPKGNILYLQDNKNNTKTAEENIDVGGDLKKTRLCKFYKQGRCKFGENCRNLHEKETSPRFNKKKSSGDKRGKYNNPYMYTVQSTKNEPSLTENPVRNILSEKESPQIQDLFTVTKDTRHQVFFRPNEQTTDQYCKHCEGKSTAEGTHVSSNYVPTNSISDNAQDALTISTSSSEVPSKSLSSNPIISINKISCLYDNCDSLLNKIEELKIRLFDKNILISGNYAQKLSDQTR